MNNRVGMVSLGCSKNRVDTENILGLLDKNGFVLTNDASFADIIIVNTCGFIVEAKQESINTILEMAEYKRTSCCKILVVTGCLSERYASELQRELPEVDLFWGVRNHEGLVRRIMELAQIDGTLCANKRRVLTTPPYRAFLRIADGCDNKCSYCAIPLIRGSRVSTGMDELVLEAERLADDGVRELTVIAQDTSAYGLDIYGEPKLSELLERLSRIDLLKWIRVLYTYPDTVDEKLIDTIINNEKIVNYIDIPIQHIDNDMLKAMNRRGTQEHIRRVIEYTRGRAPDFVIRSTVIVGFPGETDEQFDALAKFVESGAFDRLGVFSYSCEDGTPAGSMPCQITDSIKRERESKIMLLQKNISRRYNEKRIGSITEVLIEGVRNNVAYGRSYAEAAEVDGVIWLDTDAVKAGDFVTVRLTRASDYDMQGVIL